MENVPESWTIDDFRDVGTLNAWKEARAKHAGDEERLGKALEMLHTVSRDNSRTPVQWDNGPNAGFCPEGVKPWIKVHEKYTAVNVAAAQNDPDSMLAMWSRVLKLRNE
jgi:oligo-1,6-glucosidase